VSLWLARLASSRPEAEQAPHWMWMRRGEADGGVERHNRTGRGARFPGAGRRGGELDRLRAVHKVGSGTPVWPPWRAA
jgi:hypothetical protein